MSSAPIGWLRQVGTGAVSPSERGVCREREEVTISYGNWPNDVFLLFFGFLPDNNQHDAVVLFHTLEELVSCYLAAAQQQTTGQSTSQQQQPRQALAQQQQQQLERTEPEQRHQRESQHRQRNDQSKGQARETEQAQSGDTLSSESHSSLVAQLEDRLGPGDWNRYTPTR